MAMDVSTLAIKVASTGIDESTAKLDKLSASADKVEVATAKFATSASSSYKAVSRELQDLQRIANTTSIVPGNSSTAGAVAQINSLSAAFKSASVSSKRLGDESKNAFQTVGTGVASMRALLGGGLIAGTLMGITSEVIKMADSWTMMNARLQVVTGSMQAAAAAQETIYKVSQDLRVPLEATTQLYSRLIPALRAVGKSTKEAEDTTRGIGLALKLSGATGAETSSVMLQFSQAMQAGRLNGAEFNAVAEGSPLILQALQDSLGKTRGELKKMGSQGKLTADVVVDAIKDKLPEWDAAFTKLPLTVDEAMVRVRNAFTKAFGEANQLTGVTATIAGGLKLLADNAQLVVTVIGVGLVGAITFYLAKAALFITTKTIEITQATLLRGALIAETQAVVANALVKQQAAVANASAAGGSVLYTAATTELTAAKLALTAAESSGIQGTAMFARAIGLLTNPLTWVVVAIGAIGYALYENRDAMVEFGDETTSLGEVFKAFWKTTKDVFNGVYETVSKKLEAVMKTVGPYLDIIGGWLAKFFTDNKNGWIGFAEAILLYIPRALDTGIQVFTNFAKSMNVVASAVVQAWVNAFDTIGTVFERAKDLDVKGVLQAYKDGALKAIGITKDLGIELKSTWGNIGQDKGPIMSFLKDFGSKMEDNIAISKAASDQATIEEARMKAAALAREERAAKDAKAAADKAAADAAELAAQKELKKLEEARNKLAAAKMTATAYEAYMTKEVTKHSEAIRVATEKTNEETAAIQRKIDAVNMERAGIKAIASEAVKFESQKLAAQLDSMAKIQKADEERLATIQKNKEGSLEYYQQEAANAAEYIKNAEVSKEQDAQARVEREKDRLSSAMAHIKEINDLKQIVAVRQVGIDGLTAQIDKTEELSRAMAALDLEKYANNFGTILAESFGNVGKSIADLITNFTDLGKEMKRLEKLRDAALAGEKDQGKIAKINTLYANAQAQAQGKAYADMAKSAKGFFKEHTAGYKVMNATEKAFRTYELVMAAKVNAEKLAGMASELAANAKLLVTEGIAAVLNQGSGDPYTAFARMAAMASFVASLGVSLGGGGGGGADNAAQDRQDQAGTGSILGDMTAKSESISRSIDMLVNNSSISVEYNAGMLASLRNIEAAMTGLSTQAIKSGVTSASFGSFSASSLNSMADKSKLSQLWNKLVTGIFGGKKTLSDYGITSQASSVQDIMSGGLNAQRYTDIRTSGGLFRSSKTRRQLDELPKDVSDNFNLVVSNIYDGVHQAAKSLGLGGGGFLDVLNKFVVDIPDISLKDLSAEEIQKQFSNVFSKVGDDMAKYALPALEKYQKVGEGYFETLMRVASNIATLDGLFLNIGIDSKTAFGLISENAIDAKMQLIEFAGGLDKFSSSLSAYYDKYYTEAEKQKLVADSVSSKLSAMSQTVIIGATEAETLANFRALVEKQDLSKEADRRVYAALLEIAPQFADIAASLTAGTSLGAGSVIPQTVLDAATAWWDAKGGGTVDNQQVIADNMVSLNTTVAKDETVKGLVTQMSVNNTDNQTAMMMMISELKAANTILAAKVDSLTATVADTGKKTVGAITDTVIINPR